MKGGKVTGTHMRTTLEAFATFIRRPTQGKKLWIRIGEFLEKNPAAESVRNAIAHDMALEKILQVVEGWKREPPMARVDGAEYKMNRIEDIAREALGKEKESPDEKRKL